jgi:hypothetical protein
VTTYLGGISRDDLLLRLDLQHASRWFHDRVRGVAVFGGNRKSWSAASEFCVGRPEMRHAEARRGEVLWIMLAIV